MFDVIDEMFRSTAMLMRDHTVLFYASMCRVWSHVEATIRASVSATFRSHRCRTHPNPPRRSSSGQPPGQISTASVISWSYQSWDSRPVMWRHNQVLVDPLWSRFIDHYLLYYVNYVRIMLTSDMLCFLCDTHMSNALECTTEAVL